PVPPAPKPVPARPVCTSASLGARIAGPRRVVAGQQVTWRIRVRNAGHTLARSLRLTDQLPAGFSLVRGSPRVTFSRGVAVVRLRALRTGRTTTVTLTMHAGRDIGGTRLQRVRVTGACQAVETALARVRVSPV